MTSSHLITVVIPYHQNIDYLRQAVDSVCRQTLLPAQLVIIDNSAEGDAASLLKNCPMNVRYIRSACNQGLAYYFNQCLEAAQTPWCTILHSDDVMLPNYIETMASTAEFHPEASGIFCKTYTIDKSGRKMFCLKDWLKNFLWPRPNPEIGLSGENGLLALMRGNFIMCPTMCYHVPMLQDARFDPQWSTLLDLELYGRLLLNGKKLIGIRQVLYSYRRHPTATTKINQNNLLTFIETVQCLQQLAAKAMDKNWPYAAAAGKRKTLCHLHVILHVLRKLRLHNIYALQQSISRYMEATKYSNG